MRRSVALVLTAALCTFAVAGIHADEPELFPVRVHLRVQRSILSRVNQDNLKEETASLWRPYGVQLEWSGATGIEPDAFGFSLEAIVERQIDGQAARDGASVLGTASVEIGRQSTRPIHVSFEATERMLGYRTSTQSLSFPIVFEQELTRALARVLAHEIGHVLLAAPNHDEAGLMRAIYSPNELAEADQTPFRLTCFDLGRLRSRLRLLTGDPEFRSEPLDRTSCITETPRQTDGSSMRKAGLRGR